MDRSMPHVNVERGVSTVRAFRGMKDNNKYNGWTNYATWRVMLELFERHTPEDGMDADYCKEVAEDIVEGNPQIAQDYANAFLDEVNWYEVAEAINENE